jgi:hypothetical protein
MPAMTRSPFAARAAAGFAVAWLAAAMLLSACGGGGDEEPGTGPVVGGGTGSTGGTGGTGGATSWTPSLTDTWQWQLKGTVNTAYDVTVYDVDLFDTPQATIDALKAAGRRVVCYFSAGSSEDWRADASGFAAADKGHNLDGWPGEHWLDTRSANVRSVMSARLDLAVSKGCDGVEPDNMDGYTNNPGFPLNATTQLDYNRHIAAQARARGLKVGLKNDIDQLAALAPDFDFAVNEQCHQYGECDGYTAFTRQGKPVFNAEYASAWANDASARATLCQGARAANLRTLVLALDLDDSLRLSCD